MTRSREEESSESRGIRQDYRESETRRSYVQESSSRISSSYDNPNAGMYQTIEGYNTEIHGDRRHISPESNQYQVSYQESKSPHPKYISSKYTSGMYETGKSGANLSGGESKIEFGEGGTQRTSYRRSYKK